MRKFVTALALATSTVALSGCFTFDAGHNRHHMQIVRKDIRELHNDLDFVLGLEQESPLVDSWYR